MIRQIERALRALYSSTCLEYRLQEADYNKIESNPADAVEMIIHLLAIVYLAFGIQFMQIF